MSGFQMAFFRTLPLPRNVGENTTVSPFRFLHRFENVTHLGRVTTTIPVGVTGPSIKIEKRKKRGAGRVERTARGKENSVSRITRKKMKTFIFYVFFFFIVYSFPQPFPFVNPLRPRVPRDVIVRGLGHTGSEGEGRVAVGELQQRFVVWNFFFYLYAALCNTGYIFFSRSRSPFFFPVFVFSSCLVLCEETRKRFPYYRLRAQSRSHGGMGKRSTPEILEFTVLHFQIEIKLHFQI